LWNAISYLPAGFMSFFHSGPIAWTGALALYIPLASFFTWMVMVSVFAFRNLASRPELGATVVLSVGDATDPMRR
jgi:hypothetical protein